MATIPSPERLLRRSRSDRILGGVCGGIAHYLAIDTLLVRLFFIVIAIAMGSGVVLYLLLWLLIPAESAETAQAGGRIVKPGKTRAAGS